MKYCPKCEATKSLDDFPRDPKGTCGRGGYCKLCRAKAAKKWYTDNQERAKAYARSRKIENREHQKKWYARNKNTACAKTAERRALVLSRIPSWADPRAIKDFYTNTPEGYHVDHWAPLKGDNVSGLHVIENLQYLPAEENLAKGNRF